MCLIIDTCCVPSVFNAQSKEHAEFIPVLHWVTIGKGRMIYGGTRFNAELARLPKYFPIIKQLSKQRRAIEIQSPTIDKLEKQLEAQVSNPDFDDAHLVALVTISKCRVVCTKDQRFHPYLQDFHLYPKKQKPPKIYSAASHVKLCCDKHLVAICKQKGKK